jgi:hypothetical protein
MKKLGIGAVVLAIVVAGLIGVAKAVPATQTCTITKIGVTANRMSISCSETSTIHQIAGPGYSASCPAHSADDMRNYESLLLSAYLANKKITIQYDTPATCTGPANLSGSRVVFALYLP